MTLVLTEDRGPVRHVVLNRPEKRNALNAEVVLALRDALDAARIDNDVAAWSSAATGRCSRVAWTSRTSPASRPTRRTCAPSAGRSSTRGTSPRRWPSRSSARSTARCIGGAMELALACDLRVMASDAIIGMPETRVGLIPDVGGSSRLPSIVGLGRAKEMIMASKLIDGTEAERIGLVNRVAPADELDAATEQLVNELLACAPLAVGLRQARARRRRQADARGVARARGPAPGDVRPHRGLHRGHPRVRREARAGVQRALTRPLHGRSSHT